MKRWWEARRTRRLAERLRRSAKVMDALMSRAGLTRQQRREVYRKAASAQSFADVFAVITPRRVKR